MTVSPQNPYESYIVEASAGTGKTYQLSRRFLFLVGAGAAPGSILTITFTVKAAGEMRARILEEATRLLFDPTFQIEFEAALADFLKSAVTANASKGFNPRIPRTAKETAKEILSSTQLLKISTIDSLFNQWVAKFPWESGIDDHGQSQMPTPFRIMDSLTKTDIDRLAWNDVFGQFDDVSINSLDILEHYEKNPKGPFNVIKTLEELNRQNSFLWKLRQESEAEVYHHPLPSECGIPMPKDEADLVRSIQGPLAACAAVTTNPDEILSRLAEETLDALLDCKIITKSEMKVSGIKIKGKKRDALASEISVIDAAISNFNNEGKVTALNRAGLALYQIYVDWTKARESRKSADKFIEFRDLSKGAYRLFNRADGLGATWLIQKSVRHLMIDEFQDTSLLQWSIFKKLSEELLSGQYNCDLDGLGTSVFIVGDAKQSIYGFREGDPIVLEMARSTFRDFDKAEIPLDSSFRTAQIILDFVNAYFSDHTIAGFRHHATAKPMNDRPHVPNCGKILIRELFMGDDEESTKPVEKEAAFLAATLRNAISEPEGFPVYDKKTEKFRPLRPEDCCILYRSSTNVAIFEDALRNQLTNAKGHLRRASHSPYPVLMM
jgi:ATP-dependent exoDNAse (exonuclease V) beta subunit